MYLLRSCAYTAKNIREKETYDGVLRASAGLTLFSHYGFSFDVWCLVSLVRCRRRRRRRVVVCEPHTQSNRAQQHKRAEVPSFPRHLHSIIKLHTHTRYLLNAPRALTTQSARRLFRLRARTRAAFWKSCLSIYTVLLLYFYVLHTHTHVFIETFIWPSSKVFGAAHHQLLLLQKKIINEIRLKWERTRLISPYLFSDPKVI